MWSALTRSGRFAMEAGRVPLRLLLLTFSQLQHKQVFSIQVPLYLTGRPAAQKLQTAGGGSAGDMQAAETKKMHYPGGAWKGQCRMH